MSEAFRIRNYAPADEPACYEICLRTGDDGADGSHLYSDRRILGHIFVGPYLRFEPDLALVLEDDEGVCGYCLGTADTAAFYEKFLTEWVNELRAEYTKPGGSSASWNADEKMRHYIHEPHAFYPEEFHPWPAHLHIDLLPRAHRRGFGTRMMRIMESRLEDRGASGAHLGVAIANTKAQAFYRRLGYRPLPDAPSLPDEVLYLGKRFR